MELSQIDWIWFVRLGLVVLSVGVATGLLIPTIKQLVKSASWTVALNTGLLDPQGKYEVRLAWLAIVLANYLLVFILGYYIGGSARGYLSRHKMRRPQFTRPY